MNYDERMMQRLTALEREVERLKVKESPGTWLDWTPTLTSITGTITTSTVVGKYVAIGKLIHFWTLLSVTTNGTGAGALKFTLPVTNKNEFRETVYGITITTSSGNFVNTITGVIVTGYVAVYKASDSSYPVTDGQSVIVNGFYEAA